MARQRVVIGMSGGVDSSVAAWLLKQQGHEVIGLFMKNWEDDDDDAYCSTRQDWLDAVSVADVLGIDIEAVNFAAEYKDRVFAEFLREYQAGRTPNPDVLCNAEIKFKAFLDHALRLGADHIATGHYARVRQDAASGNFDLLKAVDASKDQSYFLHRLNQAQLSRTLFPLGEMHKTEIRDIAARLGLPNAAKKDSTGICFIGERPFREFLNRYLSFQPGPMQTDDGTVVGEHVGLSFFIRSVSARASAWVASRAIAGQMATARPGMWRARTSTATPSTLSRAMIIRGFCRRAWERTRPAGLPASRRSRASPAASPAPSPAASPAEKQTGKQAVIQTMVQAVIQAGDQGVSQASSHPGNPAASPSRPRPGTARPMSPAFCTMRTAPTSR